MPIRKTKFLLVVDLLKDGWLDKIRKGWWLIKLQQTCPTGSHLSPLPQGSLWAIWVLQNPQLLEQAGSRTSVHQDRWSWALDDTRTIQICYIVSFPIMIPIESFWQETSSLMQSSVVMCSFVISSRTPQRMSTTFPLTLTLIINMTLAVAERKKPFHWHWHCALNVYLITSSTWNSMP